MDRSSYLAEIRRLETIVGDQGNEIVNLKARLQEQSVEVATMAHASMEVRQEDVEELALYEAENKILTEFVERVAASRTKFSKDARKLINS